MEEIKRQTDFNARELEKHPNSKRINKIAVINFMTADHHHKAAAMLVSLV